MKNWELARRDLLKQLGLGLACLPILHSTRSWAQGAGAINPTLMIIHASEGYRMSSWMPAKGPLTMLPASCVPLQSYKDYLLYLTDMTNPNYKGGERFGHEAYGSIFWGGAKTKGPNKYQEPVGSTMDQAIADQLDARPGNKKKEKTLALQIQLDRQPSQKVPGGNRCFWRDGQAVNPESNPQETYNRLFAGAPVNPMGSDAGKKVIAQKKSILDYVGHNLEQFRNRVSTEDRKVVDGHLASIRDLENELGGMGQIDAGACGVTNPGMYTKDQILATDNLFPKILDSYMDMMFAAVKCGVTNVATLQISDSTGNQINFGSFVDGIPPRGTGYKSAFRNWHDLGHNPVMNNVDHHKIVDLWCMDKFAKFLGKVKAVPQGGGTFLDNNLVMWTNHMEDGQTHASQKVPWLLAGKVGKLNVGNHVQNGGPIQSAMADIMRAMGCDPKDPFTGSIPGALKA
jgi:hypothetical protein